MFQADKSILKINWSLLRPEPSLEIAGGSFTIISSFMKDASSFSFIMKYGLSFKSFAGPFFKKTPSYSISSIISTLAIKFWNLDFPETLAMTKSPSMISESLGSSMSLKSSKEILLVSLSDSEVSECVGSFCFFSKQGFSDLLRCRWLSTFLWFLWLPNYVSFWRIC